jgi:hypothetical protein
VPAGEARVLHTVGRAGECGSQPAGVAGYGAVADEGAQAVGLGCVFAFAIAHWWVHCIESGEEAVYFGVQCWGLAWLSE